MTGPTQAEDGEGQPPACVACTAEGPARLRSELGPDAWARVQAGKVVIDVVQQDEHSSDPHGTARGVVEIPAPPDQVWQVLTDFEHWPDFTPNVKSVTVEQRDAGHARVRQSARIFWSTISYTTNRQLDPEKGLMTWTLDPSEPHNITAISGSAQLIPVDDRKATIMEYQTRVDIGFSLPAFVEDWLAGRSLPEHLRAVRREVERRAGTAGG